MTRTERNLVTTEAQILMPATAPSSSGVTARGFVTSSNVPDCLGVAMALLILLAGHTTAQADDGVMLQTGAYVYSYSFDLPDHVGRVNPQLTLTYNSQSSGDGLSGVGWSLSVSSVTVTEAGRMVLTLGPVTEWLAQRWSNYSTGQVGWYTEHEQFLRIVESDVRNEFDEPCFFYVTDKFGTKYTFGGKPLSGSGRLGSCLRKLGASVESYGTLESDAGHIGIWLLVETEDTFGNKTRYRYHSELKVPRLWRIDWSFPAGNAFYYYVLGVSYEPSGHESRRVIGGIPLYNYERIKTISLGRIAGGIGYPIRAWKFGYYRLPFPGETIVEATGPSFLETITVRDPDTGQTLPATRFVERRLSIQPNPDVTWASAGPLGHVTVGSACRSFKCRNPGTAFAFNTGLSVAGLLGPRGLRLGLSLALKFVDAWANGFKPRDETWFARQVYGLSDVDGDGRPDRVALERRSGPGLQPDELVVRRNAGSGFGAREVWLSPADNDSLHLAGGSSSMRWVNSSLMDFNGDGLPDLVEAKCSNYELQIRINSGSGFSSPRTWKYLDCFGMAGFSSERKVGTNKKQLTRELADMDGDGWLDEVNCHIPDGTGSPRCHVKLNDGRGYFGWPKLLTSQFRYIQESRSQRLGVFARVYRTMVALVDVNGDGLPDMVYQERASDECTKDVVIVGGVVIQPAPSCAAKEWRVRLNLGGVFEDVRLTFSRPWPGTSDLSAIQIEEEHIDGYKRKLTQALVDVNGDGLPDLVLRDPNCSHSSTAEHDVRYNLGWGFGATRCGQGVIVSATKYDAFYGRDLETRLFDLDGDGIGEQVMESGSSPNLVLKSMGKLAYSDLVAGVINATGGWTDIKYAASSSVHHGGTVPLRPVVTAVTQKPYSVITPNSAFTTSYSYSGGSVVPRPEGAIFTGFGQVDVTDDMGTRRSYFTQDAPSNYMRLIRKDVLSSSSQLLGFRLFTYATDTTVPYRTPITASDDYLYRLDGSHIETKTLFRYDSYGNVIREEHYGDTPEADPLLLTGDERTIARDYIVNLDKWILALPSAERVCSGINVCSEEYGTFYGALKTQSQFYYDGLPQGSVTEGFLSARCDGLGSERACLFFNSDPSGVYQRDPYGRLTSVTDPRGMRSTVQYASDWVNFVVSTTSALGHTVKLRYYGVDGEACCAEGPFGQLRAEVSPNAPPDGSNDAAYSTFYHYDAWGRKTKEILAGDTATTPTVSYDYTYFYGMESSTWVARNEVTIRKRDTSGTLDSRMTADGFGRTVETGRQAESCWATAQTIYNTRGMGVAQSEPECQGVARNWDVISHDAFERVTAIDRPDGDDGPRVVNVTYDGRKRSYRDELGRVTESWVDAYGNVVAIRDPGDTADSVAYQYDVLDNVSKILDKFGHTTEMQYDSLGRITYSYDDDRGPQHYYYDPAGNLVVKVNRLGSQYFGYDALKRLVRADTDGDGVADITHTYDDRTVNGVGQRVTSVNDNAPSASQVSEGWTYDPRGRVVQHSLRVDDRVMFGRPTYKNFTTGIEYDVAGRLWKLSSANGLVVEYAYNAGGQVESIKGNPAARSIEGYFVSNVDYDAAGRMSTIQFDNGSATTFSYHPRTRNLSAIATVDSAGGTNQCVNYQYYDNDNVKYRSECDVAQWYDYDDLNRLTYVYEGTVGGAKPATPIKSYAYDAIGNLTRQDDWIQYYDNGAALGNTTRGGPHAITRRTNGTTMIHYRYDPVGNLVSTSGIRGKTLSWTATGMPWSVTPSGGNTTSYLYDAWRTRRRARVIDTLGSEQTVYYAGGGYQLRTVDHREVKGINYIFLYGQRIAQATTDITTGATSVQYMYLDSLRSTSVVADRQGGVTERIRYWPYGATRDDTAPGATTYKFTGQEWEQLTGYYNYNARLYDPVAARFLSTDEFTPDIYDSQALNPYSYVLGNPLRYGDASGGVPEVTIITETTPIVIEGTAPMLIEGAIWKGAEESLRAFVDQAIGPAAAYEIGLPLLAAEEVASLALDLRYLPRTRGELDLMTARQTKGVQTLARWSLRSTELLYSVVIPVPTSVVEGAIIGVTRVPAFWKQLRWIRAGYKDAAEALGKVVPEGTSLLSPEQIALRFKLARRWLKVQTQQETPWAGRQAARLWDWLHRGGKTEDELLNQKTPLEVLDGGTRTNKGVNNLLLP